MLRSFAFVALLLVAMAGSAGEIEQATVRHKDGVYTLALDIVVASRYEPVYALITDYDHLYRISEVLIETTLLSQPDAEVKRRRLVIRTCILVFCFTTRMVEDVQETGNTIIATIVPEQSDYKHGKTEWYVASVDAGHSRIRLLSELEPDFWIPPFIGPWLM